MKKIALALLALVALTACSHAGSYGRSGVQTVRTGHSYYGRSGYNAFTFVSPFTYSYTPPATIVLAPPAAVVLGADTYQAPQAVILQELQALKTQLLITRPAPVLKVVTPGHGYGR